MPIEVLILLQFALAMLIALVVLLLILRRQKQTIATLKEILTDVKEDLTGEGIVKHFQQEIDVTTAHCRKETIALTAGLEETDLAIALRYYALKNEASLLPEPGEVKKLSWRDQIQGYQELAAQVTEFSQDRIDHAAKLMTEVHREEMDAKGHEIKQLDERVKDLEKRLKDLGPLQSFIKEATEHSKSRNELEQTLHRALLAICENFPNTEDFRELVFLLHEAFHESFPAKQTSEETGIDAPDMANETHNDIEESSPATDSEAKNDKTGTQ